MNIDAPLPHGEESRLFISYENLGTVSASGDNAPLFAPARRTTLEGASSRRGENTRHA